MKAILSVVFFISAVGFSIHASAQESQLICQSVGDTYTECEAGMQLGFVRVVAQYSKVQPDGSGDCLYGNTWGFFGSRIWVNHGCYAKFGFQAPDQTQPTPTPAPQPPPQDPQPPTSGLSCQRSGGSYLPYDGEKFIGSNRDGGFYPRSACEAQIEVSRRYNEKAICSWTGYGYAPYLIATNQVIGPAGVSYVDVEECAKVIRSSRNGFVCNLAKNYWVPYFVDSTKPAAACYNGEPVGFSNPFDCQDEINNARNYFVCTWNGYNWQPFTATYDHVLGEANAGFNSVADCRQSVAQSRPGVVCNWQGYGFQAYTARDNRALNRKISSTLAGCYSQQ